MKHQKLVVILGPTASGKSALAVRLAKKFNGEIISADSRQVYKGLNIGSGKITKSEMMKVPHHLLSIASPKRKYTVSHYQKLAHKAIGAIQQKGKIPFLVGGSPFYIYAVTDGLVIPGVKPNYALRKKLAKLPVEKLFQKLQKLDPQRAKTIEQKNPVRLIRALEIVLATKKPVPLLKKYPLPYPALFLGIKKTKEELKKSITQRLEQRLKKGMIEEVKNLHEESLSWRRLEEFGLEYRFIAQYLQKKLSYEEMKQKLLQTIVDFSRRQMTWFKKDLRIHWIANIQQAKVLLKNFLR